MAPPIAVAPATMARAMRAITNAYSTASAPSSSIAKRLRMLTSSSSLSRQLALSRAGGAGGDAVADGAQLVADGPAHGGGAGNDGQGDKGDHQRVLDRVGAFLFLEKAVDQFHVWFSF